MTTRTPTATAATATATAVTAAAVVDLKKQVLLQTGSLLDDEPMDYLANVPVLPITPLASIRPLQPMMLASSIQQKMDPMATANGKLPSQDTAVATAMVPAPALTMHSTMMIPMIATTTAATTTTMRATNQPTMMVPTATALSAPPASTTTTTTTTTNTTTTQRSTQVAPQRRPLPPLEFRFQETAALAVSKEGSVTKLHLSGNLYGMMAMTASKAREELARELAEELEREDERDEEVLLLRWSNGKDFDVQPVEPFTTTTTTTVRSGTTTTTTTELLVRRRRCWKALLLGGGVSSGEQQPPQQQQILLARYTIRDTAASVDSVTQRVLCPLRVSARIKALPQQTQLVVQYGCSQAQPSLSTTTTPTTTRSTPTVTDVSILASTEDSVQTVMTKPTAIWNNDKKKMLWRVGTVDSTTTAGECKLLAQWEVPRRTLLLGPQLAPLTVKYQVNDAMSTPLLQWSLVSTTIATTAVVTTTTPTIPTTPTTTIREIQGAQGVTVGSIAVEPAWFSAEK